MCPFMFRMMFSGLKFALSIGFDSVSFDSGWRCFRGERELCLGYNGCKGRKEVDDLSRRQGVAIEC